MAIYVFTIEGDGYHLIALSPRNPDDMLGEEMDDECVFLPKVKSMDKIFVRTQKTAVLNKLKNYGVVIDHIGTGI